LINESLCSKTSQAAPDAVGTWNSADMHLFVPERWLEPGAKVGAMVFNPRRGPMNSFGGGPRGCFGRRLAYMELRILVVLLFFNFQLLPISPDMRSYRRKEQITVEPADCHVRLKTAPLYEN
jgi:cytochrome P450